MSNGYAGVVAALAGRMSSVIGPRGMRLIAGFNKHVNNPVQRLWAPRLTHMAVIEHTGRTSGATYTTPVMAFVEQVTLSVVVNYRDHLGLGPQRHGRRHSHRDPPATALPDE